MPRSGQFTAWRFRRPLGSRGMLMATLTIAVLGIMLIAAAPPDQRGASLVGASSGFSLFFAYLFFHYGIECTSSSYSGQETRFAKRRFRLPS